jgi:hypothetical protein
MTEIKHGSPATLDDLHERTSELVSRFSYLNIVFSDARNREWADLCSEAGNAVQYMREGLGIAIDVEDDAASTFWPEHLARGGVLAAQVLERLASSELTKSGLN